MKIKTFLLPLLCLFSLLSGSLSAQGPTETFRRAQSLYEAGLYAEAGQLFRSLYENSGDPLAQGYAILCAATLSETDYEAELLAYEAQQGTSSVLPRLLLTHAGNLFNGEQYSAARSVYERIEEKDLPRDVRDEYRFKKAYSAYRIGDYAAAKQELSLISAAASSPYLYPSEYALGYILYSEQRFPDAFPHFSAALSDPDLAPLARYYMAECRFMQKDYRYVVQDGVRNFDAVAPQFRSAMGRLISESYLILGDARSAVKYYDENVSQAPGMKDADWFYAGSVHYAVENWEAAIENFSKMKNHRDSLWQVASYHIAYSDIQLRNKVDALNAFQEAASLSFDPELREDAFYNWAKLAFDINNDPAPFDAYMREYPVKENNEKIYSYIALSALLNHDYAAAIEAYDNIDELDEKDRRNFVKANYLRSEQLITAGSWRSAIPHLRSAAYYAQDDEAIKQLTRYWLAQSYYMDEKYEDAGTVFTDMYNTSALYGKAEGKQIPYDLAYCFFKEENWVDAAKWFDRYLQDPEALHARDAAVRRADCDFYRKDYKSAAAGYDALLSDGVNPDEVYIYYQDALSTGLLGNRKRKIALLEHVLQADKTAPLYSEALYELGSSYVDAGRSDDAARVFKTLKAHTQDDAYAAKSLLRLGMITGEKRNYTKALEYYKTVVSDYPDTEFYDAALGSISAIYNELGQGDKYIDYVAGLGKMGDKSESEKEQMYFASAEQVFLSAQYGKAISALENFQQRYPESSLNPKADYYIAECYRQTGKKDAALDRYSRVVDEGDGPYVVEAMRRYADLAYSVEKYADSFGAYAALHEEAASEQERYAAALGMMRSAYRARNYADAVTAADWVRAGTADPARIREADYVKAKSCLASSRRDEALGLLRQLAEDPMTAEGAEARYLLIQDAYDRGNFSVLSDEVTAFSATGTPEVYWLARSLVVLGDAYAAEGNTTQARYVYEGIARNYEGADDIADLLALRLSKVESAK